MSLGFICSRRHSVCKSIRSRRLSVYDSTWVADVFGQHCTVFRFHNARFWNVVHRVSRPDKVFHQMLPIQKSVIARKTVPRQRAVEACLKCKSRKAKCSDTRPCTRCLRSNQQLCEDIKVSRQSLAIIRNVLASPAEDFIRFPQEPRFKRFDFSAEISQNGWNGSAAEIQVHFKPKSAFRALPLDLKIEFPAGAYQMHGAWQASLNGAGALSSCAPLLVDPLIVTRVLNGITSAPSHPHSGGAGGCGDHVHAWLWEVEVGPGPDDPFGDDWTQTKDTGRPARV